MKKLTKAILGAHGMHNPYNLCAFGGGKVFLSYSPSDSHSCHVAKWGVHGIGFNTDPNSHWMDYGSKTFTGFGEVPEGMTWRQFALEQAKAWATEKYGIAEWERDVFGGWQDKRVMERVRAKIMEKPDGNQT